MANLILTLIHMWQRTFSPDHGGLLTTFGKCRYYPSCSEYSAESFRQYGPGRGFMLSLLRIIRCNPFSRGGYDPIEILNKKSKNQNQGL